METSKHLRIDRLRLLRFGLICLVSGILWGLCGVLQYAVPGLWRDAFSFQKIRPLHVSSVLFWIILTASGSVVSFMQEHTGRPLYSSRLLRIQLYLFLLSFVLIVAAYVSGLFGGREYWEFPPAISLLIVLAWIMFILNFFRSIGSLRAQPVYVWMWATGVIAFLFTFLESYLWLLPWFRTSLVHDMTVQWKSYGSMVGSWNMLIYGCSLFLMGKLKGDHSYSRSPMAFLLYFVGLTNLMFNWGHHIYTLPTHSVVRSLSYLISMTELFILGRILWTWRAGLEEEKKYHHLIAYRFLFAADVWVLLNLILAILMSVPAINVYTHGTHITVAHAMGTTIGINSMLLFAFVWALVGRPHRDAVQIGLKRAFAALNISLLLFWLTLIAAGMLRAVWQMQAQREAFSSLSARLHPVYVVLLLTGTVLAASLLAVAFYLLRESKQESVPSE